MATATVSIPVSNFGPNPTNGATATTVHDTNLSKYCLSFDASTENRATGSYFIPGNWSAGFDVKIKWRAAANSGACVWKIYYAANATAGGNGADSTATTTTTTAGTNNFLNETTIALTTGVAANRMLVLVIARDAANVGDTLAVAALIESVEIEYTNDATVVQQYDWIPANAFTLPTAGSVALVRTITPAGVRVPYLAQFNDSAGLYAYARFNLPSCFSGSCVTTFVYWNVSTVNAVKWGIDATSAAVGTAVDPTFTVQTPWSSVPSAGQFVFDSLRALVVSPAASDEVFLRVTRDNTDTSTTVVLLLGIHVQYAINNQTPGQIRMDPVTGAVPGSNGASLLQVDGSNGSRWAARYTDGVEQKCDYIGYIPSTYSAGGTLRVRWSSSAASGNLYGHIEYASPTTGADSDPALVAGSSAAFATAGANLVNEATFTVTNLAALDLTYIRFVREGDDVLDTLGADVDVNEFVLDITPSL
jgi:hypothetical protein